MLPGISGLLPAAAVENPYQGSDVIQLNHFDITGGSNPEVGIGIAAGSGNSSESIVTTGQKFGAGCFQITSTAGYWRFGAQAQWNIAAAQDFTQDIWALPTSAPGAGVERTIWTYGGTGSGKFYFAQLGPTGYRFHLHGTNYDFSTGFDLNTWHHFAICRVGTNTYMFFDGQLKATQTGNSTAITPAGSSPKWGEGMVGRFDEFHFQKGTGRWTASFTPLDVPYTSTP